MATKDALSDPEMRRRINEVGGRYVDRISEDLRPELFMELSQKFTRYVDISTPRLKAVLEKAWDQKVPCTMAMFGEVAFSMVAKEEAEDIAGFLREASPGHSVEVVGIDDRGARLT
jgi:pantoate kinase